MAMQFTPDGVCLAHVRQLTGSRPVVSFCAVRQTRAADGQALEKLGREARLGRFRCTFLLNSGEYQMLVVEAPNVPAAELRMAVRWRMKDMLDFPADA